MRSLASKDSYKLKLEYNWVVEVSMLSYLKKCSNRALTVYGFPLMTQSEAMELYIYAVQLFVCSVICQLKYTVEHLIYSGII